MTEKGTEPGTRLVAGPREWAGLALLALPTLLLSMDITILYLAVPHLARDLGADSVEILWISDIYGLLIAGFLVTMGALGDRIGRRRLLMIGAAAFALASSLAAYSTGTTMLIVARAVLGVAGATLMPSTLALISNMFHDARQRGTAIGVWAACLSGGVALGPLVGGALLGWFWWGAAFLVAVPVMILLLVAAPLLLPEFKDPEPGRIDAPSVLLSLATMLPIVHGIKHLAGGGSIAEGGASIGIGLFAAALFVRRQHKIPHPLVDLNLFRSRRFSAALILLVLCLAAVGGTYLLVTVYLQEVAGLSPLQAGLWLLLPAVAMTATAIAAPRVAARFTAGSVLCASLIVAVAGFVVLSRVPATSGLVLLITGIVIVYIGQGPVMALITDLIVGSAPPRKAGAASAISETGTELGLALGVAVFGSLGIATYRNHLHVPESVPSEAAEAAHESIADATLAGLSPTQAADLAVATQQAFATGLNHVAVAAAVTSAVLAILAAAALRSQDNGNQVETHESERET